MKKFLLAAYIFFFTGGCIAQQRENKVVAEIDFNNPTTCFFCKVDTVRATLLITRDRIPNAFSYEGYAVIGWMATGPDNKTQWDTTYLDDRKRLIKPPITVWGMKEKEGGK